MNPLILQIIGGLLAIGFIVLLVMCRKSWRITHILCAFCVFGGAATFLVFASFVVKTQNAWRSLYESYATAVKTAERKAQVLLSGDPEKALPSLDSIRGVRAELLLTHREVGRSWRGCRPVAAVDKETVRVNTVPLSPPAALPTDPAAAPPAVPAAPAAGEPATPDAAKTEAPNPELSRGNGITHKMVLYVFAEKTLPPDKDFPSGLKVPGLYLGKFWVKEATDTEVSLSPLLPIHRERDQEQLAAITESVANPGSITWSLYELMPIDGHDFFAEPDEESKMMLGMNRDELARLLPNTFAWPVEQYERFLQQYQRFNREAKDEDAPENKWLQVEFLKAHKIQVDSDATQSLLDPSMRHFDTSGRAVETTVRRGSDGSVEFAEQAISVFDQQTAETLIADGVCKKIRTLYRRSLHDYEQTFSESWFRHLELERDIARAARDAKTMEELKLKAEQQVAVLAEEKVRLEKDKLGFRTERDEAENYAKALEAARGQALQRLSELYRTNNQLADELRTLQLNLANEINKRALEATARTTGAATTP